MAWIALDDPSMAHNFLYVARGVPIALSGLLASAGWAQNQGVAPATGVSTGEPALDAVFAIGLGLLLTIVVVMVGHSYWAYQRARRHSLQDSEDAVRNLDK